MRHDGSLNGLWIVRTGDTPRASTPLLARVQDEVFVLAFTNAPKAASCCEALSTVGRPFYVCTANIAGVEEELRAVGARGFIVDYDAGRTSFTSAHSLPREASTEAF